MGGGGAPVGVEGKAAVGPAGRGGRDVGAGIGNGAPGGIGVFLTPEGSETSEASGTISVGKDTVVGGVSWTGSTTARR